jgi:exosortase family protein XrtM
LKNSLQSRPGLRAHPGLMLLFVLLLMAMQFGWGYVRGSQIEHLFIDELTVKPAAWLITLITPEIPVQATGNHLAAPGGGLNILNGCDGTDVMFMLVAALLVAPLPLQRRLAGILYGCGLIYICNQARILALFYSYRSDRSLFNLLHGLIAPMLLICIATVFFVLWFGMKDRSLKSARVEA